jgi:hypothetical protein
MVAPQPFPFVKGEAYVLKQRQDRWWKRGPRSAAASSIRRRKRNMNDFAGLDVSVKETSICIVDDTGRIVREVKVASEPEALAQVLTNPAYHFKRLGWKSGRCPNGFSVLSTKWACRCVHTSGTSTDPTGRINSARPINRPGKDAPPHA